MCPGTAKSCCGADVRDGTEIPGESPPVPQGKGRQSAAKTPKRRPRDLRRISPTSDQKIGDRGNCGGRLAPELPPTRHRTPPGRAPRRSPRNGAQGGGRGQRATHQTGRGTRTAPRCGKFRTKPIPAFQEFTLGPSAGSGAGLATNGSAGHAAPADGSAKSGEDRPARAPHPQDEPTPGHTHKSRAPTHTTPNFLFFIFKKINWGEHFSAKYIFHFRHKYPLKTRLCVLFRDTIL